MRQVVEWFKGAPNDVPERGIVMAKMPREVITALGDEHSLKVLATADDTGLPNAAIVATITPLGEEMVAFADLRMGKTRDNLDSTKKFAVTVLTPQMKSYQIKGTFEGFQETGPLAASVNEMVYNAIKMQIKAVGLGSVDEVYSACMDTPGAKLA
ncbi:MAG: hypothetical protein C4589_11360 [Peptococcaceae bacterium]|nr:MAG: hypothetical protein C4589_11360 [Peptococcaceae bacterium]